VAIIGSDMQEVIGTAIALYLLSHKVRTWREEESAFFNSKQYYYVIRILALYCMQILYSTKYIYTVPILPQCTICPLI
jgi:hypothetical protein